MELSKYIKSESVELNRSAIHFADYNPRKLSDESRKTLKRGIKKFGLVGGIVVNKRTGLTVVSGHQRLSVMDELQKFPDNDYRIRHHPYQTYGRGADRVSAESQCKGCLYP